MENILIAYNNDPNSELHLFFESCADDAKQFCVDNQHCFESVCPPGLLECNVTPNIHTFSILFFAAHGDSYGIYNENDDDIVSTRTNNYDFAGKTLYTVSCLCAEKLMPELKRNGLDTFVGYDDQLRVVETEPMFRESAMEGLKAILEGVDKDLARSRMFNKYTECINNAKNDDIKMYLLHNREHLCFE